LREIQEGKMQKIGPPISQNVHIPICGRAKTEGAELAGSPSSSDDPYQGAPKRGGDEFRVGLESPMKRGKRRGRGL